MIFVRKQKDFWKKKMLLMILKLALLIQLKIAKKHLKFYKKQYHMLKIKKKKVF